MNLLAVDTSGPVAGVAVLRDGEVAYEGAAVNRLTAWMLTGGLVSS